MDQGFAVIIAAILAIAGIFYASRQQRILLRKQHTFQIIDKLNTNDTLNSHVGTIAKMIKERSVPTLCDDSHKESCEHIDYVLNYYEVIATAIVCGDIDEELIRRMERGRLTRCYLQLIPYIDENRDELGIKLWENLEFITYRWCGAQIDQFTKLVDAFQLRPTISAYAVMRDEIRYFLLEERSKL